MSVVHYGTSHVPLSPAVRAGDYIYISGQVPVVDGKIVGTTIQEHTEQVMKNLVSALELAGCKLTDVIKCVAILPDMSDFSGFNEVYGKYFSVNPPARTAMGAALAGNFKVEVEAIAFKPV